MRTRLRALALSALLGAMAGCHQSVGARAAEGGGVPEGEVTVRVVNHSWLDVTVYIVQGTRRERLGSATATSTTTFTVALRRLANGGEYRLLGDPVGSRTTVRSEPLLAQDGDVVTWTLEDNLARSSIDVR
jgi:hypothetical protein